MPNGARKTLWAVAKQRIQHTLKRGSTIDISFVTLRGGGRDEHEPPTQTRREDMHYIRGRGVNARRAAAITGPASDRAPGACEIPHSAYECAYSWDVCSWACGWMDGGGRGKGITALHVSRAKQARPNGWAYESSPEAPPKGPFQCSEPLSSLLVCSAGHPPSPSTDG